MVRDTLHNLDMNEGWIPPFMKSYVPFMEEQVRPGMVGVTFLRYRVEFESDRFVLRCETNKQLNQNSRFMILFLTRGFIAGWTARGVDSPKE